MALQYRLYCIDLPYGACGKCGCVRWQVAASPSPGGRVKARVGAGLRGGGAR